MEVVRDPEIACLVECLLKGIACSDLGEILGWMDPGCKVNVSSFNNQSICSVTLPSKIETISIKEEKGEKVLYISKVSEIGLVKKVYTLVKGIQDSRQP